jgi:hypothetical protein
MTDFCQQPNDTVTNNGILLVGASLLKETSTIQTARATVHKKNQR